MPDLNAALRAKLAGFTNDACLGGCGCEDSRCDVTGFGEMRGALTAVLDLHKQSETHVWDVPRDPSGKPRIELNPWCRCQERDGMSLDEVERPCETVRAIAKELGVEAERD